jgi:NADH:ubiquinone oxidoreductase subunit 2 (subunit N)
MSNVKNMYNTEASLKYFIVQVLASATLLFIVVIKTLTEDLFMFVVSIMFLIVRPNVISILLGWDGLGLVSYLLVIYYQNVRSYGVIIRTIKRVIKYTGIYVRYPLAASVV